MGKEDEEFQSTLQRLLGWRESRLKHVGTGFDPDILGRPTPEGRSEFDINDIELEELMEKIGAVRNLVLTHGKSGTEHPAHDELLDDHFRREEDFPNYKWITIGSLHANADINDIEEDEENDGYFLQIIVEDSQKEVIFTIGFDYIFHIEIRPFDIEEDELPGAIRHSFPSRIDYIARNEYIFADKALDRSKTIIEMTLRGEQN